MQDKNMSRADLWAFASLVAVSHGVHNNNEGCRSDGCGTLRKNETDCEIEWPRIPNFKTGRSDCIADQDAEKPWYASRPEIHPDPHGNGPMTVDFFKQHFELNAQEAIALVLGAHSFANFHSDISQFRYEWTRKQRWAFNNQMVRHAALQPQYFSDCKSKYFQQYQLTFIHLLILDHTMILTGDSQGNPAKTSWAAGRAGFTKNKGPFHWFHRYER